MRNTSEDLVADLIPNAANVAFFSSTALPKKTAFCVVCLLQNCIAATPNLFLISFMFEHKIYQKEFQGWQQYSSVVYQVLPLQEVIVEA